MPGNKIGGAKAAITNKKRHGEDFYAVQGAKGGKASTGGGFASDKVGADGLTGRQRASVAGAIGGKKSRRTGVRRAWSRKEVR